MKQIDLNCDLGEGFEHDHELMPLITSANIACGGHAGDATTMQATVALAKRYHVGVGAHPGYEDREHFGRREIPLSPRDLERLLAEQIATLCAWGPIRHVKPHGALYNLAARDRAVAEIVVRAVKSIDPALILFGLASSELVKVGEARGLRVAAEVFADRSYQRDGSLTPRTQPNALIENENLAAAHVLQVVLEGKVRATDGTEVPLAVDTICLHGDGDRAVEFARRLRRDLQNAGIRIEAVR